MEAYRREVEKMKQLQEDAQRNAEAQQKFIQQQHENEMVLKELQSLDPEDGVFKLIGPALVRQEPDEAVQAVQSRLAFIAGELSRLEEAGKQIGADADKCQARCAELQQKAIRESTQAAGAPVGAGGAAGGDGVVQAGAQAQPAA